MKKILLVVGAIVVGFYILANWNTVDPEVVEHYKKIVVESQKQENQRMLKMARKMHPVQVMRMVQDSKNMTSQMILSVSDHPEIKKILQNKLKALEKVKSKEDYIQYLQSGT